MWGGGAAALNVLYTVRPRPRRWAPLYAAAALAAGQGKPGTGDREQKMMHTSPDVPEKNAQFPLKAGYLSRVQGKSCTPVVDTYQHLNPGENV